MRAAEEENEFFKKMLASEALESRNETLDAINHKLMMLHIQVQGKQITDPTDVINAMRRWVQDGLAASIHLAHLEALVSEDEMLQSLKDIYGYDDDEAKRGLKIINEERAAFDAGHAPTVPMTDRISNA